MPNVSLEPDGHHPDSAIADRTLLALLAKVDLLTALGRGLHRVGLPAHRLEAALVRMGTWLDTPVQVLSLPTGMMLSIDGGQFPVTRILRIEPGVVDLERLDQLTAIVNRMCRGGLTVAEARAEIDRAMQRPPRWGKPATVLAYLLSAAAFSVFFGGAQNELIIAMCVGLATGLLALVFPPTGASRRLFEFMAAMAAAIFANSAYALSHSFVEWIPLASGLIILLPGLALVDSLEELAHGQLVAGGARLAGVAVVLLAMTFRRGTGVGAGRSAGG